MHVTRLQRSACTNASGPCLPQNAQVKTSAEQATFQDGQLHRKRGLQKPGAAGPGDLKCKSRMLQEREVRDEHRHGVDEPHGEQSIQDEDEEVAALEGHEDEQSPREWSHNWAGSQGLEDES